MTVELCVGGLLPTVHIYSYVQKGKVGVHHVQHGKAYHAGLCVLVLTHSILVSR